jgi:hypothetical protein
VLKASTAPGASIPPGAGAPIGTAVSKTAATVTSPRVGVLKINTRAMRPGTTPSLRAKGKQARVDERPPLASTTTRKASMWP